MTAQTFENPWLMAGTEGTDKYYVVIATGTKRVGIREYAPGYFRVRVEVGDKYKGLSERLTRDTGWKQPGDSGEQRFSKTTCADGLAAVLAEVFGALKIQLNPRLVPALAAAAHAKAFGVPEAEVSEPQPLVAEPAAPAADEAPTEESEVQEPAAATEATQLDELVERMLEGMAAVATEATATAAMVQDVYRAAVAAAKERLDAYRF